MITVVEVDAKVNSHVDICAVRYEGIEKEMRASNARLRRIEQILLGVAGTLILLLLHMVIKV